MKAVLFDIIGLLKLSLYLSPSPPEPAPMSEPERDPKAKPEHTPESKPHDQPKPKPKLGYVMGEDAIRSIMHCIHRLSCLVWL